MLCRPAQQLSDNLRRWRRSDGPRRWVESHQGQWNHGAWLALLAELQHSEFWPLDPEAVGLTLEEFKRRWWNLRRWRQSGQPRDWVDERRGAWSRQDWLDLLAELQESEFWPLNPDEIGLVLKERKQEWANLQRWIESGAPARWAGARGGRWDHAAWLALTESLRGSKFWPLDLDAVGAVLDSLKPEPVNLRRWLDSGQARAWVAAQQARWDHTAWLALLEALEGSDFWPLDPEAVGAALQALKLEWWNLRRWRDSGLARRWVQSRPARYWDHRDWLALVDELQRSPFWPMDLNALRRLVEELRPRAARAA
jgi:hypothetical protein